MALSKTIMKRTIAEHEAALGEQIKAQRLRKNLTREEVARQGECSVSAIKNLEGGTGATLGTLIKVVKVIGRESWLDAFAPEITISPISMVNGGRTRQRARNKD